MLREDELEDLIKQNTDYLFTKTVLTGNGHTPEEVLKALRSRKTTGQVVFNLSQGGVQSIQISEKTKATEAQSQKIREILGVD